MQITVNAKQVIALIWTLLAAILSIFIALVLIPYPYYGSWQLSLVAFFGCLLIITLPVYLLMALWMILARNNEDQ